jgi:thiamine kinase-like enzyme
MAHNASLDPELIARIERLLDAPLASYWLVQGGYTPALRLLCATSGGRCFVKVGSTPLTSAFLRREISIYNSISGPFMPQLIACEDHESAPILIIEDLSLHSWPPPWDQRSLDLALAQIAAMHATPALLEPFAHLHGARSSSWQAIANDPQPFLGLGMADLRWLDAALPDLLQGEARCRTDGTSLTHWDLRSDNMCITDSKAIFVDWNLACLSNPALDLGFWLPSLAYEGGPLPEQILPDAPEVAAWVAGFFAVRAGLPQIADAPRVRLVQRQQLEVALPWAVRALGLPPLPQ